MVFVHDLLPPDAPIGLNEYNNGIFCYLPKEFKYLNLAVGYNKDRDTATIRLKGCCFMPERMNDGRILLSKFGGEYDVNDDMTMDEYNEAIYDENGDLTIWIMGLELGEIVELSKK